MLENGKLGVDLTLNVGINGALPKLESLSGAEVRRLEDDTTNQLSLLSKHIDSGDLAFIYQGNGQLTLVSKDEQTAFRSEQAKNLKELEKYPFKQVPTYSDQAVFFSGMNSTNFSNILCRSIGVEVSPIQWRQFQDGELSATSTQNVRERETVIIQSLCPPTNENLIQLCLSADALTRGASSRITAVIPYLGYARQDHPDPRSTMGSALVAKLLEASGVDRIITLDIHSEQSVGYFKPGSVSNLSAIPIFANHIKENYDLDTVTIVSPDAGGVKRAEKFVKALGGVPIAIFHKDRSMPNVVSQMVLLGDVKDRTCVIVDDMVDTGGTLIKAADKLIAAGAKRVIACCTHAVLSGNAMERIGESAIEQMIVTDTIPLRRAGFGKFKTLSVAPLLGNAVARMLNKESLSCLS